MPESRYTNADAQKRLALLRRQVYGGSAKTSRSAGQQISQTADQLTLRTTDSLTHSPRFAGETGRPTDTMYLRQDLTKIALLSSLALGAQLLLYFLFKNHLLRLNLL